MGTEDNTPSTRESSKRLVEIAQEVMQMHPPIASGSGTITHVDIASYNALLVKAKSLAGSVIAQADPND